MKITYKPINCDACGKEFTPKRAYQRFCRRCRNKIDTQLNHRRLKNGRTKQT